MRVTIDFSEGQQLNEQDLICTDSGPVSNSIAEIGDNKKIPGTENINPLRNRASLECSLFGLLQIKDLTQNRDRRTNSDETQKRISKCISPFSCNAESESAKLLKAIDSYKSIHN
jgi:hypothetical protein